MKKLSISVLLISSVFYLNAQSVVWQDKEGKIHSTAPVGQPVTSTPVVSNVIYQDKTGKLHNPGFNKPVGTISNFGPKVSPITGLQIKKLQDKVGYEADKINHHLQAGHLLKVQEHAKKLKDAATQLHELTKSVNNPDGTVHILPVNEPGEMHILPYPENNLK